LASQTRTGQAFESELVDERLDLGEVGDLLAESVEVIATEGMSATPTGDWPTIGGGAKLRRWDARALVLGVTQLSAALAPRGRDRRLAPQSDGIGSRRLGGIRGVELEPGFEIVDPPVLFVDPQIPLDYPARERAEHGQDGGLCRRGHFISEFVKKSN
jgi:hypothetical protein